MTVSCSICLRDVQGAQAATIPCGHVFDAICITQCLQQRAGCPICNNPCTAPDVRAIYFTRTDNNDDIIYLQNKVNQITYELSEARKEIAYKLPNTQLLNDQIDHLKKINQLQENEIGNLKAKSGSATALQAGPAAGPAAGNSGIGEGKKNNTTTADTATTNATIEKQAREIKDLKAQIAEHNSMCKETNYEAKYEKLLEKCQRLKRQKDETQRNMDEMYRDNANYEDKRDQEQEDRIREMEEMEENLDEYRAKHGNIEKVIAERDAALKALKKFQDKKTNKQKSNGSKPAVQNTGTSQQRTVLQQQQQRPDMQQSNVQQQQRPPMQQPNVQQQQRPPMQQANLQQHQRLPMAQQQLAPHQQQMPQQPQMYPMQPYTGAPQQPVSQQQPVQPHLVPHMQHITQQQGNTQWEIYVAPSSSPSKKRKQTNNSNAGNLQPRVNPQQPQFSPQQPQQQQQSPQQQQFSPQTQQQMNPQQQNYQYGQPQNSMHWQGFPPSSPIPGNNPPQQQQQVNLQQQQHQQASPPQKQQVKPKQKKKAP